MNNRRLYWMQCSTAIVVLLSSKISYLTLLRQHVYWMRGKVRSSPEKWDLYFEWGSGQAAALLGHPPCRPLLVYCFHIMNEQWEQTNGSSPVRLRILTVYYSLGWIKTSRPYCGTQDLCTTPPNYKSFFCLNLIYPLQRLENPHLLMWVTQWWLTADIKLHYSLEVFLSPQVKLSVLNQWPIVTDETSVRV